MTTKQIVEICNISVCDSCEINSTYCDAYCDKFLYSPAYNNIQNIRKGLNIPDSAYSESEVIEL